MTSSNKPQKAITPKGVPTPRRPENPLMFIDNIQGFIRTVDAAPTYTPVKLSEQFAIFNSGGVFRFYWYDTINQEWRFATGT